jgi:hypothetical protein
VISHLVTTKQKYRPPPFILQPFRRASLISCASHKELITEQERGKFKTFMLVGRKGQPLYPARFLGSVW